MKNRSFAPKRAPMSADAYAGFLKLWLTPAHRLPEMTPEVEAYLRHANEREPLSDATREALGQPTRRAA
ncbi:MAG TPA: hypothetical protein VHG08_28285 [Longimicrobium sp.]|jgi:hypothetical protein|nr:hypothetical protein [Longimicrobium sp.]